MKAISYRLYYKFKPFFPKKLRLSIRRFLAKKIINARVYDWPIDHLAATKPISWKGWPDNKRFALVLTHDVETAEGLKYCSEVMRLEESLGFRSSFNVVIRDYEVSDEFRKNLASRGFELGIHGLTHKGNPFRSEKYFREQAVEINKWLKRWNAVGFRAPSMYHDLRKLHYLDIDYDASTFDTDPFEPQPDGLRTIFPIWVYSEKHKKGYVEIPYTLPQDHLLFLILGEKTISIWLNKLEWIASCGGMALLITHPEYMDFSNGDSSLKYPASYYKEFLSYIKEKYESQYWNPLPKELAAFWKENYASDRTQFARKLHVVMPAYTFYEVDNRVMRYARTLADAGNDVEVLVLKSHEKQASFEIDHGVKIYRLQSRKEREKSGLDYLIKQSIFLWKTALFMRRINKKLPIDIVHVHSIPDFEVFSALFPKLKGSAVILDIHDLVPELYLSRFGKAKNNISYRVLLLLEKLSCKFADHVIIANHLWYEKLTSRSVKSDKCSVIMNYPDDSIFYPREKHEKSDKFVVIYPGTISFHQGLDIAIEAMSRVINKYPNTELRIYGDGPARDDLINLIKKLKVTGNIRIYESVPLDKISSIMANADLGIVPKRDDAFAGEAFSTKILEFMALGIPVIVSATKIDRYYFNESVVKFFKPNDIGDLEKCLIEMIENDEIREKIARNSLEFSKKFGWSKNKYKYFEIINKLSKERI